MIGITTEKGTLRIAAEISIPNGQHWSPGRIQRLMMDIERYVFAAEMTDKAAREAGELGPRDTLPPRKPNIKSGLVIDA